MICKSQKCLQIFLSRSRGVKRPKKFAREGVYPPSHMYAIYSAIHQYLSMADTFFKYLKYLLE
jgi:hypothetical protein